MRKPELLILIAIWEFLTALAAAIGIAALAVWASLFPYMERFPRVGDWRIFAVTVGIIILVIIIGLGIAGGIGLLMGKEWGRITAIVHSALSLFSIPIGTIIGILALIYLTRQGVVDYFISSGKQPPSTG